MAEQEKRLRGPYEYHQCVPSYQAWKDATGMTYQYREDGPEGIHFAVVDREGKVAGWLRDQYDARFVAIVLPANRVNEDTAWRDHQEERELAALFNYEDDMRWLRRKAEVRRRAALLLHETGMSAADIGLVVDERVDKITAVLRKDGVEPLVSSCGRAAEVIGEPTE